MFRRIASVVAAVLVGTAGAQAPVAMGNATLRLPAGWTELSRDKERVVFRSGDDHHHVTVSLLKVGKAASFDDFKRICEHRLEAERRVARSGSLVPQEPFQNKGGFQFLYSGRDEKSERTFSGFLSLQGKEVVTLYLESSQVAFADHAAMFKELVGGMVHQ